MAGSAGDKTEKPTARRLKDAREKGEVARSRDLTAALSLAAVTIALGWFGASLCQSIAERLVGALRALGDRPLATIESTSLTTMLWTDAWRFTLIAGPTVFVAGVVSVGASVAQGGWMVSPKAAHMNWGRLNPSQGFSRLAPKQAGPELAKALVGMAVLGVVCYIVVRESFYQAPALMA